MAEAEKERKEEIIKDGVSRLINGTGDAAMQAIGAATIVLKAGLDSAEELSAKTSDLLLNTTRRAVNAGNVVATDVREMTRSMVRETIRAASEIGDEVKGAVKNAATTEPEEKSESK